MTRITRTSFAAVAAVCALGGAPAFADGGADSSCHAPNANLVKLMVKTTVILVPGYRGLPSEYQPDGDLDTLELVHMPAADQQPTNAPSAGTPVALDRRTNGRPLGLAAAGHAVGTAGDILGRGLA